MPVCLWSRTDSSLNQGGDPSINWNEGQSPSSINDSARNMMRETAKFRDDIAGAIVTGGTSTAYTVSSYSNFSAAGGLSKLNGQVIAFTPHATNGGATTLNVDGLGALPLRQFRNIDLGAGVLIQGTPYTARYDASSGEFNLSSSFGPSPYLIPVGALTDFIGTTAPNSSFVLPFGQPISRSSYATLFAMVGTTFGVGDGSTTFNLPDLRGRVVAGKDDMGGTPMGRIGSVVTDSGTIVGATLGSAGGSATHVLTTAEMPVHSHNNTLTDPGHTHGTNAAVTTTGIAFSSNAGASTSGASISSATTGITITNASAGSGNAHAILQPTIVLNKILRII